MPRGGQNKGFVGTIDNPGSGKILLWVRDVAMPYRGDDCLIYPFARSRDGYATTVSQGKAVKIHRLICERIHGKPPTDKHHAAHSCGNGAGGCCNPRHLSWKTPSENFKEGERHPKWKLTAEQVAEIRSLRGVEKPHVTAKRFPVTECTIRKIQTGRLWPMGVMTYRGKPTRKALTTPQCNSSTGETK